MRSKFMLFVLVLIPVIGIIFYSSESICYDCSFDQCTADTQCGSTYYCMCHKPRNQVYGTCIAR